MSVALDRIADQLRPALTARTGEIGASSSALERVQALAERQSLAALLEAACTDDTRVVFHARLSHTHPLGFDKLVLIDEEPAFSLRLHVWWPHVKPTVEHVHNHRFGFASVIILGGYDMRTFTTSPVGLPMAEYREGIGTQRPDWQLEPVGPAHLAIASLCRMGPGACYALGPETLHQVVVAPRTFCVTLFLESAVIAPVTRVFAPVDSTEMTIRPKRPFTAAAYRARLDAVLAELAP